MAATATAAPGVIESVTERLAGRIGREPGRDDLSRAALHLLDWLGCALIGSTAPEGRILSGGLRPADWLAQSPDPAARAFALGGLGSVFEMDDVHRRALVHPGPVIMPAVLSFGPDTAPELALRAMLAGYEAMVGIGRAVGRQHYRFFHPTSTLGGFGAAAAASVILGLDREQTVWALGTAGSTAGGLFQCLNEPVMTKQFHISEAARRGVAAARLAQRGLTGPRFILEGPQGFFAALAADADPDAVARDPDAPWLMAEVSFKPWPACRHVHAVIDAALALRPQIAGRSIAAVDVESYADALRICDCQEPRSMHEGKFSLQHAAALTLSKGRPALDDFMPEALPAVAGLRARVTVAESARFTQAYPGRFGAAVTVTLDDGSRLVCEVPDAWGDPENPMADSDVLDKARMLMDAAGYSAAQADAIAQAALGLAEGGTLGALARALAAA